jgi:uncharacterized protein YpmB
MRKVFNYIKENRKIIIVTILVVLLIGAIFLINNSDKTSAESVSSDIQQTETEIKLKNILSNILGVGETNVLINQSGDDILGVVIVCKGADNIMVKNDILNAVSTALNIKKNIIAIYSMTV